MREIDFIDHLGKHHIGLSYEDEIFSILFQKYGIKDYGECDIGGIQCYVNDNGGEITFIVLNYGVIVSVPYEVNLSVDEITYHGIAEEKLKTFDSIYTRIKEHLSNFEI